MDESWRTRMGMPSNRRRRHHHHNTHHFPRRLSAQLDTSATATSRRSVEEHLDPEDFDDVFGGPPRSVLLRKFSGDYSTATATAGSSPSFYEEIFRQAAGKKGGVGVGRSLPAFRIPARGEDGFYSDVFGVSRAVASEEEEEEEEAEGRCVGRMSRERSRPISKAKTKSNSSSVLSSEELSPLRRTVAGDDVALSCFASKLR